MTRKQTVKSLAFPELTVAVVGDAAIARHIYFPLAESELEGEGRSTTRIGALQVWQKQDGGWAELLARQGFRRHTGVAMQVARQVTGAPHPYARLNAGITCAEKRSSCSRITACGVPTGWPTLTTSRPGYLCWSSISCSVICSGGPISHVPALIAWRRVGRLA